MRCLLDADSEAADSPSETPEGSQLADTLTLAYKNHSGFPTPLAFLTSKASVNTF